MEANSPHLQETKETSQQGGFFGFRGMLNRGASMLLPKLLKLFREKPLLQPGQDHVYCAHYEGY